MFVPINPNCSIYPDKPGDMKFVEKYGDRLICVGSVVIRSKRREQPPYNEWSLKRTGLMTRIKRQRTNWRIRIAYGEARLTISSHGSSSALAWNTARSAHVPLALESQSGSLDSAIRVLP